MSVKEIAETLQLAVVTIIRYLNIGNELNKCSYNGQVEKDRIKRRVICITTGKIYESINSAAKENELTSKALHRCCNSKFKRLGKLKSGEPLIWMYYDEFLNASPSELKELDNLNPREIKKVLCITTGKVFNNQQEAANYYNCDRRNISYCCNGKRKFCGKLHDGTKLQWTFI